MCAKIFFNKDWTQKVFEVAILKIGGWSPKINSLVYQNVSVRNLSNSEKVRSLKYLFVCWEMGLRPGSHGQHWESQECFQMKNLVCTKRRRAHCLLNISAVIQRDLRFNKTGGSARIQRKIMARGRAELAAEIFRLSLYCNGLTPVFLQLPLSLFRTFEKKLREKWLFLLLQLFFFFNL